MATSNEGRDEGDSDPAAPDSQQGIIIPDEVMALAGKYASRLRWRSDVPLTESERSARGDIFDSLLALDEAELRSRIADACALDRAPVQLNDWRTLAAVLLATMLAPSKMEHAQRAQATASSAAGRRRGRPKKYGDSWSEDAAAMVFSIKWEHGAPWGRSAMSDAQAAKLAAERMLRALGKRTIGSECTALTKRIRNSLAEGRRATMRNLVRASSTQRTTPYTDDDLPLNFMLSTGDERAAAVAQLNAEREGEAGAGMRAEWEQMLKNLEQERADNAARRKRKG